MKIKIFDGDKQPHELLLTRRQKTKLRDAFENNISADKNLSKTQISKIIQSGVFLGTLLSKIACPLTKVTFPLANNILASLGTSASASAIDAGIQRKIYGSRTTTLIISKEEMNDIMKIVQALKDLNILLKDVNKTNENGTKEQIEGLSGMLLGTIGTSWLKNMLAGKGIARAEYGNKGQRIGFLIQRVFKTASSFV